jgi:3-methyl-2-oxobutanoate hydroxymethyltransferase
MRKTIENIKAQKRLEKLVVLTAYSAPIAKLLDPHVDILLVGDSLGMVIYGMDSTLGVTLDMMIAHGKAVVKASEKALVVVDMPYGTYENSPQQALQNAKKIIEETGAQAVKLETGIEHEQIVRHLVENNIPVMAHVGLKPQSVEKYGGYKIQGKNDSAAAQILMDAIAMQDAGAFSIVIEGVKQAVAEKVTATLKIPTIGIGASVECDGQVLVIDDMLGITESPAKFVKKFANLSAQISAAAEEYSFAVRGKKFPDESNCY